METHRKHIVSIVSILGIVVLPLLFKLPLWVAGWCFALWGYAALASMYGWPWPNRPVRLGFTFLGVFLAWVFLGGRSSGNVFIGLLCIMASLKSLEIKGHRDRMVTLFMAYFVIISSLFVIENLFITLYMFFSVLITTAGLIHFNHPHRRPLANLRLSAVIMVQALPLMALLFVLFPRSEGTFFSLRRSSQGRTGFSETLRPGAISRLVQEDKIAFRVEFQGDLPAPEELYWRGLVLWAFDGNAWRQGKAAGRAKKRMKGKRLFAYAITLEPHRKRHLFALDLPIASPNFTDLTETYTLLSKWPLSKTLRYQVQSYADARMHHQEGGLRYALQLPDQGNEKSRSIAEGWLDRARTPEAVVDQAIRFFKENGFRYTLRPQLLGRDSIDVFLFDSKMGYCEHYASAFTFLMRAAGIPARIVVGYLGGEWNPFGNYLIVKQYHAHAWTEVYLDEEGWIRIDPTALVVPERVSMGLVDALVSADLPDFLTQEKMGSIRAYWERFKYLWDAVNLRWNSWLMEYSYVEQVGLLRSILSKLTSWKVLSVIGGMTLLAVLGVLIGYRFRKAKTLTDRDPMQETYTLFCRKLKRIGIEREPSQGPLDFSRMVGLVRPELKKRVEAIVDAYITLRYKPDQEGTSSRMFQRMVDRFDPRVS